MPLAEARGLAPDAHFAPHEPRADREALAALAAWCQRFGRAVALEEAEEPESLLVDITGCGPLFGGEKALAAKVVDELRRYGYWARVAVADTIGAAWGIAHFGAGPDRNAPPGPVIVPPGGQLQALRPLVIEALRLSPSIVQALRPFDVRRVSQLLALPRSSLPSRFSDEVVHRIDQALGHVGELLTPEPVAEIVEASWSFEAATDERRMIEAVIEHLLEQVLQRLRPRQLGIQRLLCWLQTADGGVVPLRVGLLQPSASAPHLMGLVRLYCERLQLKAEVSALSVQAEEVMPLEFFQQQLFEGEDDSDHRRLFGLLIERLSNRLGEKAVLRPQLMPDAQPEYACRFEPWLGQGMPGGSATKKRGKGKPRGNARPRKHSPSPPTSLPTGDRGEKEIPPRPPCLKSRPVAVAAVSVAPHGPPVRFEWQKRCHVVAHAWGPERIETGWWRGQDVQRDYYLVESTAGQRFWMFRTIQEEGWFLHGTFA